jgi:hypothetical protein
MSRCRPLKNHDFTEELVVIRAFEFHLFVRKLVLVLFVPQRHVGELCKILVKGGDANT